MFLPRVPMIETGWANQSAMGET
uniref:Uncharacterized protein n=1 Tax=Anguilla anguilla TaxID=7936 RepID=A0A0E9Q2W0_ANGAN